MASAELRQLWKLHQIDVALVEVRKTAAALDPGRKLMAEIDSLQKEIDDKGGTAKKLSSELSDLELKQKTIEEKLVKFDKELYGGKVVNSREVENIEKEIAMLKKQRATIDERILELWELVPPAKRMTEGLEAELAEKKKELAEFQKGALKKKAELEARFKELQARRPEAAKDINKSLMAKYDAIRSKHGGIGMGQIVKGKTCGGCGTLLPTRIVESAKEDKTVTCEECHRLLYYTEGLV